MLLQKQLVILYLIVESALIISKYRRISYRHPFPVSSGRMQEVKPALRGTKRPLLGVTLDNAIMVLSINKSNCKFSYYF